MRADPRSATLDSLEMPGQRLHRFHGGLRLRHNKKISCLQAAEACPLPEILTVPLLQHRGETAECLVQAGDVVLAGQLIGQATSRGAHVHAPTSGLIESVQPMPIAHPSGLEGLCVLIRPDGLDQWAELNPLEDWPNLEPDELREIIRQAGIVGLGGAVFPTGTKTDSANQAGIHTLVINGAECEPYISCDEMLMREQPGKVVRGAAILQKAVGADRTLIAIEDQMGGVGSILNAAVRECGAADMKVIKIPTIYPEGGERQLIQVLTGVEVPDGGLPQDIGILCQNVATAAAVADRVESGRPLVERYVTVTGNGVVTPRNLKARLGTPVANLVAACGGYNEDAARLVIGGPMMGYALSDDGEPVVKASNCVLVLSNADIKPPQAEMPCIRCGECARVCPSQLMPQELHFRLTSGQLDEASDWGLAACIECGCCDFVCPSHIPLSDWFRYGKGAYREQQQERGFSDQSRLRFEAREARLAQAKQEKADRLARRKQSLKDAAARKKEIAAAVARANSTDSGVDEGADE